MFSARNSLGATSRLKILRRPGFSPGGLMVSGERQMEKKSFYRRPLPSTLVAFSSAEGRRRFSEALQDGYAETFFTLIEQFQTQSEPAYCGLTTLSVVLNALAIDPQRVWKGPWRWFSEELLDCCRPLEDVKKNGISLDEFACLGRCNGAQTRLYRNASLEDWREDVRRTCSNDSEYIVVSFDRKTLGQTGSGHFSPIAAYHKGTNSVLVLDTARFKYSPFWADVDLMHESLQPLDETTKLPRGYVKLWRSEEKSIPLSCRFLFPLERIGSAVERIRKNILPGLYKSLKFSNLSEEKRDNLIGRAAIDILHEISIDQPTIGERDDGKGCAKGDKESCCKEEGDKDRSQEEQPLLVHGSDCGSCICQQKDDETLREALSAICRDARDHVIFRSLAKVRQRGIPTPSYLESGSIPLESAAVLVLGILSSDAAAADFELLKDSSPALKTEVLAIAEQIRNSIGFREDVLARSSSATSSP